MDCDNLNNIAKILVISCFVLQGALANLSVYPDDFKLLYTGTSNFTIFLNGPVQYPSKLLLEVNVTDQHTVKPNVLDLSQTIIDVPPGVNSSNWTVTVFGKHPGNVIIGVRLVPVTPGVKEIYLHVGVEKDSRIALATDIVGWIYFTAWTVSFYPQIYHNFKKKSVIGLNFDFLGLNLIGFFLYGLYNLGFYSFPLIRDQFFDENPTSANPVQLNDVFFAIHAEAATLITIFQCFIYERGTQTVSMGARILMAAYAVWLSVVGGLVIFYNFLLIDFLMQCSLVKLTITLVKYIPQAFMNFQRKSTSGWSIGNVLLDFTGGAFSILQMILLAINFDDWEGFFIDTTKLGLGLFSVCFDILFMVQHYILYRNSSGTIDLGGSI